MLPFSNSHLFSELVRQSEAHAGLKMLEKSSVAVLQQRFRKTLLEDSDNYTSAWGNVCQVHKI